MKSRGQNEVAAQINSWRARCHILLPWILLKTYIFFYNKEFFCCTFHMTPCKPRKYLGGHLILAPRFHITLPKIFAAI